MLTFILLLNHKYCEANAEGVVGGWDKYLIQHSVTSL